MVLSLYLTTRNANAEVVHKVEEVAEQAIAAARLAKTGVRDACTFGGDRAMFAEIRSNLARRLRKAADTLEPPTWPEEDTP